MGGYPIFVHYAVCQPIPWIDVCHHPRNLEIAAKFLGIQSAIVIGGYGNHPEVDWRTSSPPESINKHKLAGCAQLRLGNFDPSTDNSKRSCILDVLPLNTW